MLLLIETKFEENTDSQASKREHQLELERLYNRNQTLVRISKEFRDCAELDFTACFQEHGIPLQFGYDLLTQMALHKRCSVPTLVNILRKHFEAALEPSQACADMLLKCCELDLLDFDPVLQQFVVRFTLSEEVQRELELYQYPLPMVVPPKTLSENTDCGYLLRRESVILRNNHHDEDVCLDHLNRMNRVKLSIDLDTAQMVQLRWKGLDKKAPDESKEDFDKRKKAFEKYRRTTEQVMGQLLQHGNEFYLTHKYDKRGRIYCQGYHCSYQGAPWNKAVIQFTQKEHIR